ncbi:PREDICTED: splicing factor U2af small subunit B-like [Camelina sativa]|uniref:Splicing factor U2af small subunit B-like n=1 Tax=Camelina sativa TaxID=90675 RepID=A0ABM1RS66_CAMSA|nr:PREDICTED: splicing factor U2af small subunit B-like [Camelina sativa]
MQFKEFYEDLFEELNKYGEIESLNICDNISDHLVGNVYVQFREEEQAGKALRNLQGRFYAGRPIIVDFSPVTDFREATCRQYEEETCKRGGYCNFMHLKSISSGWRRQLYGRYKNRHSHSRSRSPYRHRSHEDRSHERHSHSRRHEVDDDSESRSRSRRYRSKSPRHRRGRRSRSRSRSPGGRRQRSPVREGSEERRARIEQWNREKGEQEIANNRANDNCSDGYMKKDDYHQEPSFQQEGY